MFLTQHQISDGIRPPSLLKEQKPRSFTVYTHADIFTKYLSQNQENLKEDFDKTETIFQIHTKGSSKRSIY